MFEDLTKLHLIQLSVLDQLEFSHCCSLLTEILRKGRHTPWGNSANICMVTSRSKVELHISDLHGRNHSDIRKMRTSPARMIGHYDFVVFYAVLNLTCNCGLHRAKMHRQVWGVGYQVTLSVKDSTGKVKTLFNIGAD